jgi:flagellar protein FliL
VINGIAVATVLLEPERKRQFNDKEGIVAAKDEQKKDTAEKKPSGGSRKKWIILIGVFFLVAAVGGASAFFFLRGHGDGAEAEEGGEKTHESPAKKVHAIYPMEPLIVNIHDGEELRYLKVKLEFETSGPEAKAEIDPLLPPIQDAILVLLSGKQMADITTTEGKNKLREEIMASVGKIVPPNKISRVYFTDFVVQ